MNPKVILTAVIACLVAMTASSASAASIGAGTAITLELVDTADGGPRINIDEGFALSLDPGPYRAVNFSFAAGQDGDVVPFLAMLTGNNPNEYEVLAIGDTTNVVGAPVTQTVPFGGSDTFSLGATTMVFAGFTNTDASPHNPVYLDNNTPETTDHDNEIEMAITSVGQLVGSPANPMSHADLGRTYAFAIEVEAIPEPTSVVLFGMGFFALILRSVRRRA